MENKYACLMVGFDLPNWDLFVKKFVNANDLAGKGYEFDPHATIIYGLSPDISLEDVKSLCSPLKEIFISTSEVNSFECPEFDVVKFDVDSPLLDRMHNIMKTLPCGEVRSPYKPHITIAYVKPGMGIQYAKTTRPLILQPVNYMLSRPNGEVIYFTI